MNRAGCAFAAITAALEDLHGIAVEGQHPDLSRAEGRFLIVNLREGHRPARPLGRSRRRCSWTCREVKGYYNGWSPAERRHALVTVNAALADGRLKPAYQCSLCGCRSQKPLGRHSERYDVALDAFPVCKRCHWAIHIRFRRPAYWLAYIARFDADHWSLQLSLDPVSLTRPFDETYPDGLPAINRRLREAQ